MHVYIVVGVVAATTEKKGTNVPMAHSKIVRFSED